MRTFPVLDDLNRFLTAERAGEDTEGMLSPQLTGIGEKLIALQAGYRLYTTYVASKTPQMPIKQVRNPLFQNFRKLGYPFCST